MIIVVEVIVIDVSIVFYLVNIGLKTVLEARDVVASSNFAHICTNVMCSRLFTIHCNCWFALGSRI